MALPMTGQRWASNCSFDMAPPQGEGLGRADVDRARRVAGDADLRNGHMALDCRMMLSMTGRLVIVVVAVAVAIAFAVVVYCVDHEGDPRLSSYVSYW